MSIDFSRFEEILATFSEQGLGITIRWVRKGDRAGGFLSPDIHACDGWEVGYLDGNSGGELALDPDLDTAIRRAVSVILSDQGDEPDD